ncbi:patatin-like phospholipase family protein [Jatrophihabitans sp. YIM 134969]
MSRRGLVLAGGGMRVAWQTGVLTALTEAGLAFDHVDGSSGGIFTTAMLLSGLTPAEMGERWRTLDVEAFVAPQPWRAYLRSPTNWSAFGSARSIRRTVLPHLGVDLDRVRAAATPTGSFNVADFTTKRCVAVPHTDVDEDLLIAGVSLAGVMPAVERGGTAWTDAVWIKDANLTETVRRGCTEIWVAWCIANTPRWGTGALEQYVHMIEMSAVAGLTAELEWIADLNARRRAGEAVLGSTTPVTVHLVRPDLPIPLDPDFLAGRIDAETLIATGYRDACYYLSERKPDGVPLDATPTATPARRLGARLSLRADGRFRDRGTASTTVVLEADDLAAVRDGGRFTGVGALRTDADGYRMFSTTGAELVGHGDSRRLSVSARVGAGDDAESLDIETPLPVRHRSKARVQRWTLRGADGGVLDRGGATLTTGQVVRTLLSFEPSGAHDLRDRARALGLAAGALHRRAS